MPARFKLADVFKIINAGDLNKICIGFRRGTETVMKVYANTDHPMEATEANEFILKAVESLTECAFYKSVALN